MADGVGSHLCRRYLWSDRRPTPATGGFTSPKSTRRRAAPRSDAGTTHGTAGAAGIWRTPGQRGREPRSGRPGPRGQPRLLPLVRHGHHSEGIEVAPPGVAPAGRRKGLGRSPRWPRRVSARRRTRRLRPGAAAPLRRNRCRARLPRSAASRAPRPPGAAAAAVSAVTPGATVSRYRNAHLVPR